MYKIFKDSSPFLPNMVPRTIYPHILESIRNKPVTLITGARQTGKTFLCREIHETTGINYVTLADRQERELANKGPDAFPEMHGPRPGYRTGTVSPIKLFIRRVLKSFEEFEGRRSCLGKNPLSSARRI